MSTLARRTGPVPTGARTVADGWAAFLEDFAELVAHGVRSSATLEAHRAYIADLSDHLPPETPLDEVDADVIRLLAGAERAGRRTDEHGQRIPTSLSSVAKRLSTLSGMLKAAARRGWLERVPPFPRLAYRPNPQPDHFRTLDELERLAATLPRDRADWLYVATFTGQHPSDVNRMRAYLDADPFAPLPWYRRRNTKNRKADKILAMPTPLVRRLRARFTALRLGPGSPLVPEWSKSARGKALRRRRGELGLMRITSTSCRHTFATWVVADLGAVTHGLVEALGHGSPRMAETTYAHATPPSLAEVAAALSRPPRERRPPRKSSRRPAAGAAGDAKPGTLLRKRRGR